MTGQAKGDFVKFTRTDYSVPDYIEEYGKKIADHFKTKRNYLPDFCRMIISSKYWVIDTLDEQLATWSQRFGKISGRRKVIELVSDAFNTCKSSEDIHYLRGVIVEALVIGKSGGSEMLNRSNFGWGAKVLLNGTPVKYLCTEKKTPACDNRSTVDIGIWDGRHCKFYECKVNPKQIGCKEIKYLKKLSEDCKNYEVSHEIFLVSPESQESIKLRLFDLGECSILFKPLGIEQLYA